MASVSDLKIKRQGSKNYLVWSKRVKALLVRKKCWAAIDPGFDLELDNDEEEKNDIVLSYLIELVEDCYLNDVTRHESAKDARETLK